MGRAAVEYIHDKKFGMMTAVESGEIRPFPLREVVGKYRTVSDQEYELLQCLFEGDIS